MAEDGARARERILRALEAAEYPLSLPELAHASGFEVWQKVAPHLRKLGSETVHRLGSAPARYWLAERGTPPLRPRAKPLKTKCGSRPDSAEGRLELRRLRVAAVVRDKLAAGEREVEIGELARLAELGTPGEAGTNGAASKLLKSLGGVRLRKIQSRTNPRVVWALPHELPADILVALDDASDALAADSGRCVKPGPL